MSAFKDSTSRWRTFGGERFECWSVDWNVEHVAALRAAGLRVHRFEGETFMRPDDWAAASEILHPTPPDPAPKDER